MERKVKVKVEKMGFWKVICAKCPLLSALKTLEMEPRSCVAGMMTNVQGAIPLKSCKYKQGDVIDKGKKGKFLVCSFTKEKGEQDADR